METTPKKIDEPRLSYTFDAVPEDEETQDELNRRMRKPGEPGYRPPGTKTDVSQSMDDHVPIDPTAGAKKN
jgi:hypothetical protein